MKVNVIILMISVYGGSNSQHADADRFKLDRILYLGPSIGVGYGFIDGRVLEFKVSINQ